MTQRLGFSVDEVTRLAALAGPLTATALVNMGISLTDVIMMGWLGPLELATGAVTSDFYSIVFYLAAGVVAAVAPMISQARGADDVVTIRRATQQGIWAALIVSMPGFAVIWHADTILDAIGVQAAIVEQMPAYAHWMALSFVFMTGIGLWRNFLAAHDISEVIFYITAIALPMNALGNYALMFGHFGAPALGLAGAGMSSAITAAFILTTLYVYCVGHRSLRRYRLLVGITRSDWPRFGELFRIGVPIGITNLSELGIFLFATVMIGMVSVEALAAHAVALRMAGLVYSLPLGLSQAATVRVGFRVGSGNLAAMWSTITTASVLALAAGATVLIGLLVFHEAIPG